jgi:hypothetical protein
MNATTASAAIIPLHVVRAPASRLSALREKEPPIGKPPTTNEVRLPAPCETNSRFASQRRRSIAAKLRAIDDGSMKPTSAITTPGMIRCGSCDHGRWNEGAATAVRTGPTIGPVYPDTRL